MITPQTLSQSPLFAGLTEQQLAPFIDVVAEITCARGQALFREGEEARQLFILLEGRVSIQVQPTSRLEPISIASISQFGQLVGWSGFMPPNYYTATALCQENSRLLAIDGAAFMRLLEADPALGFTVMRRISEVISGRLRNIQRVVLKTFETPSGGEF